MMETDHRLLLQQLFGEVQLPEGEFPDFAGGWKLRQFSKKSLITEAGTVERYFYVVVDGVQAIYIIDRRGEKRMLGFSYRGNFSGVYDSFLRQAPAAYFLEALTDSSLLALPYAGFRELFERYPSFERWGRLFHQEILIGRLQREVELLTLSARERYVRFMRRCPPELLAIPQKYLASYLNMTPETFSRLRASVKY